MPLPVIAIFDIGKTNKKLFLFNEQYQIVFEQQQQFEEILDEDGFPSENIIALTNWINQSIQDVLAMEDYTIKAINFSAYGASFVHVDDNGDVIAPLYNYLKPYDEELKERFYHQYGGEESFSVATASPVLGNLNSGLQIYWLKHKKPNKFNQIKYALHLPQYLSFLVSKQYFSDITSIGCHTALWNFTHNRYHDWVQKEGIDEKLAPIFPSFETINVQLNNQSLLCGTGLHDSSAAIIPYLACFSEPFVLISTGTWCITLNPFNKNKLTADELKEDCLSYKGYKGNSIKAARLFAGNEHEVQTKRLAAHYNVSKDYYTSINYNRELIEQLQHNNILETPKRTEKSIYFSQRDLQAYSSYEEAYHQLIIDIIDMQILSSNLVMEASTRKIFVDGGFCKNPIYMNLLAAAYPTKEVYSTHVAQATAMGAALAIHEHWNNIPLTTEKIIQLKRY